MSSGLLSLKWNNHRSTFFHVLSSIRSKESYCDATLACDGRFYPVHKLILSTCSEYFEQIFEKTQCKHPVIVLKDIKHDDLEALMNYMYVGEVNVLQEKLAGLIKAAECLKIKGLAVPDEDPLSSKRNQLRESVESPQSKRRKREGSVNYEDRDKHGSSRNMRSNHRDPPPPLPHSEDLSEQGQPDLVNLPESKIIDNHCLSVDNDADSQNNDDQNTQPHLKGRNSTEHGESHRICTEKPVPEISVDESSVKTEPPDIQEEIVEDNKEALHSNLGYDPLADGDSLSADPTSVASGSNEAPFSDSMIDSTPQSVEDVVAQALPPTSSSFQGNSFSLWEGEGSLQNFPGEGFSGENSQGRSMVNASERGRGRRETSAATSASTTENTSANSPPLHYRGGNPISSSSSPSSSREVDEDSAPRNSPPPPSLHSGAISTLNHHASMMQTISQRGSSISIERELNCSLCGCVSFPSVVTFCEHLLTHPLDAEVSCPICNIRTSPRDMVLSCHMQNHAEEMGSLSGHGCNSNSAATQGRKPLMDEYSMSRKRFACGLCPYRAFNRSNLVIHTRMHTGEKPFACSLCSYRANHKGNLVTHMRTHASRAGRRPHLRPPRPLQ